MFRATLVAAFFYTLSAVAFLAHGAAVNDAKRDITDPFKSIASDVKSAVDGIETAVETIGKDVVTVVKDASGEAFTLATDGVGLATTIAGQAYTIITSDIGHAATATNTGNSALGVHAGVISSPLLCGVLTVLATTVLGVWVAL
ncbi:hypothetical protein L227DRAFT_614011 [Lentinus tigrinus ALCF2SS1-6]|uniref:Uncharacterized protein n=1 Tax=Lentinus tigrinus ALCF2SS1-6 TaxID=1328759 RepID=A0A5C2S114_9APHY|nr:hypothetical protein L227DRAFT_614011 [Lentinus tigrinus ALCF2SS1-6]